MLNILDISEEELLAFIKEDQKSRTIINKEQVKKYFLQNSIGIDNSCVFEHEEDILFMIKHSVSLKFISKYFNMSENDIKNIATRHKCNSQLLSGFTENENARCFSRNQILRACEEFNYICPMCFKPLDITHIDTLTGHHIQPFAIGGKTTKDNCLPLHVKCHFEDFKILHSALFDSSDPIYSAKYFTLLKGKLQNEESGITSILKSRNLNNIEKAAS